MSQLTQQIHELFAQVLHLTDAFDDDTPFIELGGQSILMGELKSRMEQMFQVDIPFDVMFAQGTVSGLAQQVEKSRNNVITGSRDADFSVDPARRFQPCPMTDLQTAYYIGRQADTELGGSPTRGYSEIICTEYDQERMTQAIRKLFQKHDVLRCCFQPDGTQQTVPEYDPPAPELEDISHMPPAEQEAHLLQKRERIFNTLFDVHQLPLVSFSATRCSGKTVIHFNHDGMIIDGWSHEKLIDELDQFYETLKDASDFTAALHKLIRDTFSAHRRIIFNGNGYEDAWIREAEKRGLANLRNTAEALPTYLLPKNIEMLTRQGVYSHEEILSRHEVHIEKYCKVIRIEAGTLVDMVQHGILNAVSEYEATLCNTIVAKHTAAPELTCHVESSLANAIGSLNEQLLEETIGLKTALETVSESFSPEQLLHYYHDEVEKRMDDVRRIIDKLEVLTASKYWPYPTFCELLFSV